MNQVPCGRLKSPRYRMTVGDPLLLDVMQAGWPRLESMIALLAVHPGVYVDVAALQSEAVMPHPAYYRYLRGLVESGFAKRIMFGSGFPDQVGAVLMRFWPKTFSVPNRNPTSSGTTRRVSCLFIRRHADPERWRGEDLASSLVARPPASFLADVSQQAARGLAG